jgi:S1-C subfamily serine protease
MGKWPLCNVLTSQLTWTGGPVKPDTGRLAAVVDDELTNADLAAKKTPSLFDEAPTGGLQLGVVITHVDAQMCVAQAENDPEQFFRGKMTMTTEWQVYDPVRAQVVARISTTATGEQKKVHRDGIFLTVLAGFRANAQKLAADDTFRAVLLGSQPSTVAAQQDPLKFIAASNTQSVSSSLQSVATILTAGGWGSGFLISADGYMLTNHHVVGDASQVRVRWSDKSETVGRVIRSDRRRDVALIQADPKGRTPLALRPSGAEPGEAVFAVGTPLEKDFQNTVTKGVVSANRLLEGQSFVQSDVAVDHGNSGGPLLDEKGRVVAITELGYAPDGVSHNLNFFIPIDDALRALVLTPVMAAPPPATSAKPLKPKG